MYPTTEDCFSAHTDAVTMRDAEQQVRGSSFSAVISVQEGIADTDDDEHPAMSQCYEAFTAWQTDGILPWLSGEVT